MKLRAGIIGLGLALYPALAHAAESGEGGGSWLSLLFYVINFAAFVYIVARFGGPAATKFVGDRARQIKKTLKDSETELQRAQDVANQWAAKLAGLESEKAALLKEMKDETLREMTRIREFAQVTSKRISADAELTAEAVAEAGRREIRTRLAARAAAVAGELIARDFESADQIRLIKGFMDKLLSEARS